MAKTCPDCGCRVYEYGCVNCNEADYIQMHDEYDAEKAEYDRPDRPVRFADTVPVADTPEGQS